MAIIDKRTNLKAKAVNELLNHGESPLIASMIHTDSHILLVLFVKT